jgi:hypothetical protein
VLVLVHFERARFDVNGNKPAVILGAEGGTDQPRETVIAQAGEFIST